MERVVYGIFYSESDGYTSSTEGMVKNGNGQGLAFSDESRANQVLEKIKEKSTRYERYYFVSPIAINYAIDFYGE